ncbi:alpha/beta hydrolase [Synechococcus sp. CS-1332]|uniref:alpha/beta hydrolase n=1 Tax=Synechococcus sp. CS-1332 TaxID=2847972 RepID=UPI00223A8323|nr:alpha/beta hydrolase [Synechococcus sp. CS-1332]MCT0208662.1 alpha/beta hydrolase [Synechococcus sp. CS-1332]
MTPSGSPDRPITELLAELEAAVRQGNAAAAGQLEQLILQQLAHQAAETAAIEQQVQGLMAQLRQPPEKPREDLEELEELESFLNPERGTPSPQSFSFIGGSLPFSPGAPSARPAAITGTVVPVWFATNRTPAGDDYGNSRGASTSYGRALVHVPAGHRFGETGRSFWKRLKRFDLRDDRLRLQAIEPRQHEAFFAELQAAMDQARQEGAAPHALIFLHGFNVSFQEAAIRAAQLDVDLNVQGATAFFSWPSRGSLTAYPSDEATIEASEAAITDFLIDFTRHCGAETVHLIAHSMGNRGLLRALQRIAADTQARSTVKFGQIFLAAPDVDRDLFLELARHYPQFSKRATLYASSADRAVGFSARLHDAPRAGYFSPYTVVEGVDTVAVPNFDLDWIGHGYFAEAEALLNDMFDLMRRDEPPQARQRLVADEQDGVQFWRFNR